MNLSPEDIKCLAKVVFKEGARMVDPTGGIAATVALEFFEQRDKGISHLSEKQTKYCQDIEKQVTKAIIKNYEPWLNGAPSEGRTDASVKAALINLPAALDQANISVADMTLSAKEFESKILSRLADFPEYKKNETARNMFMSLIFLMRDIANHDENLKPYFDHQHYENIMGKLDGMDSKLDKILERMADDKRVPIENLKPLFEAAKHEMPEASDENFVKLISDAVDALLARANEKIEIFNDSREIDIAIRDAREQLKRLDTKAALATLEVAQKQATKDATRAAVERAEIYKSTYQWDAAIKAYNDATALDNEAAWHYFEIGDIHVLRGNLISALENYRHGEKVAKNSNHQRDLSVSYNKIGNVLSRQGQLPEALTHYESSLFIRIDLAKSDSSNMGLQRDLLVSYIKIGDILLQQGQLPDALTQYDSSLSIAIALAKFAPSHTGIQRDLSVSYIKIGDILSRQGQLPEALTHYESSLFIRIDLAKSDSSNMGLQRDLLVSYIRIGDTLLQQGQLPDAFTQYDFSLSIAIVLAKSDTSNMSLQRDLSVSYNKIANVLSQQGHLPDALTQVESSLSIRIALAKSDPSNMGLQRDLSVSYDRIGDILSQLGQLTEALTQYKSGLSISINLAKSDPSNMGLQRDLIVAYMKLASLGQNEVQNYESAFEIVNRLHFNGLLAPVDEPLIETLEQMLAEAKANEA